ncbi:hypothetical protein TWF281_007418 [Arthrobotrys megalospora]
MILSQALGRLVALRLLLIAAQYTHSVGGLPLENTKISKAYKGGGVSTDNQGRLYIFQTGIGCDTPLESRKEKPSEDGSGASYNYTNLRTYSVAIGEIPQSVTTEFIATAHFMNCCLCFEPAPQRSENVSASALEKEDKDISEELNNLFEPTSKAQNTDVACQWYGIYANSSDFDSAPDGIPLKGAQKNSEPRPLSGQPKLTRDAAQNSNLSIPTTAHAGNKTLAALNATVMDLSIFKNKTIPPISNASIGVESRAGSAGYNLGSLGIFEIETRIRCFDPLYIITLRDVNYTSRGIYGAPNWGAFWSTYGRYPLIDLVTSRIKRCESCECRTESERMNSGVRWALSPNQDPGGGFCESEAEARYCQNFLGCFCEEAVINSRERHGSGGLSPPGSYLLARIGRGRYFRGMAPQLDYIDLIDFLLEDQRAIDAERGEPPSYPELYAIPDPQGQGPVLLQGPDPIRYPPNYEFIGPNPPPYRDGDSAPPRPPATTRSGPNPTYTPEPPPRGPPASVGYRYQTGPDPTAFNRPIHQYIWDNAMNIVGGGAAFAANYFAQSSGRPRYFRGGKRSIKPEDMKKASDSDTAT